MRTFIRTLLALVSVALVSAITLAAAEEGPLTNADVVKMVKLDLGDQVVIAKIRGAARVRFDTGTDALAALKQAGVSRPVIAAMLDRAAAGAPPAGTEDNVPSVALFGGGREEALTMLEGRLVQFVAPFVGLRRLMQFDEYRAKLRIRDRRPTLLVGVRSDPKKAWWFVKVDSDKDDNNRDLDVESPGMFGGVMSTKPDEDNMIAYDAREEQPGLWRITLRKDLKPGEYGMYTSDNERGFLYDFGIDK
jgi:hypothetical protein